MEIQEILNEPAIMAIENEMISLECEIVNSDCVMSGSLETMRMLIRLRQRVLNGLFSMNDSYGELLYSFNESLKQKLIRMRKDTISVAQRFVGDGLEGDVQTYGKCCLGNCYPRLHPVQTIRAFEIWNILNKPYGNYIRQYDNGISPVVYMCDGNSEPVGEYEMLYMSNLQDDVNEEPCESPLREMDLIYPVYSLASHTGFSLFDVLWVRDFDVEIIVEISL